MLLRPHRSLHKLLYFNILMGSKHLLKCTPCAIPILSSSPSHHFHSCRLLFTHCPPKPISISPHFLMKNSRFCNIPHSRVPRPVEDVGRVEEETVDSVQMKLLKEKLKKEGIDCDDFIPGKYNHLLCPEAFSKGKTYAGVDSIPKFTPKRLITEESLGLVPLGKEQLAYLSVRKISGETLRRNAVMQKSGPELAIAFTYRRNGKLVNCKYRGIDKRFWQERESEKILYGLDDIKEASEIIIVEGEIDKLSMEEAGFRNCVSVPDGAPSKVSNKELPSIEKDTKFQYLWNCKEYLDKASRIILATDADPPGQALAEELARRLGRERCWRVRWPKKDESDVCKDANEVLMYYGPAELKAVIDNAELYPIRGLFSFGDYFDEIDCYYHCSRGYELGVSTGWKSLDQFYNIMPGELTIVTGVPNSGKSEWIDAILCNLNENEGWRFALCSMENNVREHARKLLEKHIKKPFFNSRYGGSVERMTIEDLEQGKEWLNDTFHLIRCEDDCLPSIKWVLALAKAAVLRHGVRGLVIDPYNELDHQRPPNQTETEYVSQMLTKIKRFAQHHSCHVWFVAHPRQLHQWVGSPPNLYDISGSAHFINKCDNGIVVHRNRDPQAGPIDQVQICVRKVRNKVIGSIGDAFLSYNRITGEFRDIDKPSQK
ncbi:twinkle homolog protein, chloroplastic/mitochondrial isoform X2 [Telopea speciosissima]|uniref:twinkle homolog protein, chloroplastic/mitochondrial isoform X2 n=1 Tax=Telopea speciosissima TaxID=54955 RepID=UPI001CC3C91D|nr:twinkle homolog protein, chloroplastic/mitochondrial isoform X2 [Telopea speciosissima]